MQLAALPMTVNHRYAAHQQCVIIVGIIILIYTYFEEWD